MEHLPKVPDKYVKIAFQVAEEKSNLEGIPIQNVIQDRILTRNGETYICRSSPRFSIEEHMGAWVIDNITDTWTQIGVAVSYASKKNQDLDGYHTVHGPHSDLTRSYVLIYLLDSGNEDQYTVFWQEKGQNLYREPNVLITELDNLTEVDRICIPKNTWVYLDSSILHSVENMHGHRTTIQIGMDSDPFGVFVNDR
jgi:hypothetical protein